KRDSDGLWGAHWYGAVEKSTGFVASGKAAVRVPEHLQTLLAAAQPYYEALRPHRLAPISG
ncbi:MAG: HAD family hydrolase, partial [Alphaproteobacteria bacterium]|nr:HAD family hydrolase [Alphaproteobacteria bacterium]